MKRQEYLQRDDWQGVGRDYRINARFLAIQVDLWYSGSIRQDYWI